MCVCVCVCASRDEGRCNRLVTLFDRPQSYTCAVYLIIYLFVLFHFLPDRGSFFSRCSGGGRLRKRGDSGRKLVAWVSSSVDDRNMQASLTSWQQEAGLKGHVVAVMTTAMMAMVMMLFQSLTKRQHDQQKAVWEL